MKLFGKIVSGLPFIREYEKKCPTIEFM